MDVVGIGGGYLLVLMIEVPHSIHTHSRSSLYIHNVIQHLRQWLQVIRMPPHPDICYLRPLVFESHLECTYVCTYVMIETPQPLHTHIRSSLYIYNAIQNLGQWLQVIRMQPHTCNGKNYGLCVSYLSANQHTVMAIEGTDHFRLDLTLLFYI